MHSHMNATRLRSAAEIIVEGHVQGVGYRMAAE